MLLTSAIKKILFLSGMRIAAMAGHAGNSRNLSLLIFIEMKVFFIDLRCHLKHLTGDVLFGFGVTGKIQVMGSAVGGGGMAEITFYAQVVIKLMHDFFQLVVAGILRQHLQVFKAFLGRIGRGKSHTRDHKGG